MTERITIEQMLVRIQKNWPETATPETAVILGLIRLNDIVSEQTGKMMAQFDLTPAAFEVLVTLRALAPPRQLSPTELYRSILITSGGMTKVLKQLENQGAIERIVDDKDKRSSLVKLTKAGTELAEKSADAVTKAERKLFSQSLSAKDVKDLGEILRHALKRLESD